MIITSRRDFVLLNLAAISLCLGMGILAYLSWTQTAAGLEEASGILPDALPEELVFQGEQLLFASLAGTALYLGLLLAIHIRGRRRIKTLDSLFAARRSGDTDPELWEQRLGPLGQRFLDYNQNLLTLSRQRALKINGLSSLVQSLLNNIPRPLLVTSIKGLILYASPAFYKKTGKTSSETLQTPVNRHFPAVNPSRLALGFQRSPGTVELQLEQYPQAQALPIQDERGQSAYILISLTGDISFSPASSETKDSPRPSAGSSPPLNGSAGIQRLLRRFLGNRAG